MEAFIKIHGESHIFIGSRPKNAGKSLNRLELDTGIFFAARFARDSRNREGFHRPDGKNPRVLTPTTTVSTMFRAQYVAGFEAGDGMGNIDKILSKLSQEPRPSFTSKELQPSNPQQMFHTRNIGTLQPLALLKSRLAAEEPLILFNYFGMHKRAIELLRLIKAKEHHKFVQYCTAEYVRSAENSRALGISPTIRNGTQLFSRIVMSCGDLMKEYLQRNGDMACKELRVFSKNKKAIQDEIKDDQGRPEEFQYWFNVEEVLDPKVLASLMTGIPIA
ncbi:hypothetical protein BDV34DRAFT_216651 [Aspergillus parasiticus]|uniref:Uncharacterized protein n=1 Tax=Aspergillus parasiticus TaxID=5067 RepID=A0A5N6D7I2_ASPPA|nr:hypothetical protein BDV34DRAFT_216651 [Aspergillus parasiticus]